MKWHDKHVNIVDSRLAAVETAETEKTDRQGTPWTKPKVILDYNLGTQSADISDQMSYCAAM